MPGVSPKVLTHPIALTIASHWQKKTVDMACDVEYTLHSAVCSATRVSIKVRHWCGRTDQYHFEACSQSGTAVWPPTGFVYNNMQLALRVLD